jgi:hypothetical protein
MIAILRLRGIGGTFLDIIVYYGSLIDIGFVNANWLSTSSLRGWQRLWMRLRDLSKKHARGQH